MPEGQESLPQPQTEVSQPQKISPVLLQLFDLTTEDVKDYEMKVGTIIRERKGSNLRGQGITDYDNLREKLEAGVEGDLKIYIRLEAKGKFRTRLTPYIWQGEEKKNESLKAIPDQAMSELTWRIKKYGARRPKILEGKDEVLSQLKEWLRGFGDRALERDDWETAVRSLDLATDGEFINEPKVIGRLKEIAGDDKIKRIEIAKLIQRRLDRRPQASTT